jgi:CubicO group peptidase (beta-lactamase class C family)
MRKLLRIKILLFVFLFLSSFTTALSDEKTKAVDRLFAQWNKPDTPGCALAVISDGKVVYQKGYGSANLEHRIPISPRSVFYIGSVSKQFTAMSIAILANEGKISLDDDVRKVIPEVPDYGTPVTIRHLVHHTSGLRDYLTLLEIAGVDFGAFHEADVLQVIARQKELNFKPGDEYLYSNSGYFLLGLIVKRVSGRSLREFAEENIFKPLGMKNSCFHDDYTRLIINRASGYLPAAGGKCTNFISTFDCVGSGGLYTTVGDLFLWDQNFYHCRVGGKELVETIQTRGSLNNGKKLNYAFALVISAYKGLKTVSHGGALGGYRSHIVRFPEQKFSVICLSNLSTFIPARHCLEVADIYLAGQFKEEKKELKPGKTFIKLEEERLKEKAGSYLNPESGEVISLLFDQKNQRLTLRLPDGTFPLQAISENEFEVTEAPEAATARFEKRGEKFPSVSIIQEGEEPRVYERVELWSPGPDKLKEYEGDYYSEELQTIFTLALKEGKLYFVHRNAPKLPLNPVVQDRFSARSFGIHFLRDDQRKLNAFALNAGRVKNLRFHKKR